MHHQRAFLKQSLGNGMQRAAGVEDVVQQQDVPALDLGKMPVEEIHFARALHPAVVAGDVEALDFQWPWHPAEEVGGEDEGAFEQDDDDELPAGEIALDLESHRIETFENDRFVDENPLDVVAHPGG